MNTTVICNGCGGRKQVSPLGGMLKNCAICNGIGYIEHKLEPIKCEQAFNTISADSSSLQTMDITHGFVSTPDEPITAIADEIKRKLSKKKPGKRAKIKAKLERGEEVRSY